MEEEQLIVCHKSGQMIEVLCLVVWETDFGINSPETMEFIADCCKVAPKEKQPGEVKRPPLFLLEHKRLCLGCIIFLLFSQEQASSAK